MSYELRWEIHKELEMYANMFHQEHQETTLRRFGIDAQAVATLFERTTAYGRKEEVYENLADALWKGTLAFDPDFFGTYICPEQSTGVWERLPRAPLSQVTMAGPAEVLCGIKQIGWEQPHYLVRAGSLYALAHGNISRRKRLVVQRIGETTCVANSKYEGHLNMDSEGLQLERLYCGQPQYVMANTPEFQQYASKEVFVVRAIVLPDGKRLCVCYPVYGFSKDKKLRGRVQVDSSEDPEKYKLKSGATVKDTAIQMWARNQRFLHHTNWDRSKEYLIVKLPVRELAAPQESRNPATEAAQNNAAVVLDDDETNTPFEQGFITVRIRNNNKVVTAPLPLNKCLQFQDVARQAFTDQEATDTQNKIIGHLGHISTALDAKEHERRTSNGWFSCAYYLNRAALQAGLVGAGEEQVFENWGVAEADRLLQGDALQNYKEVVWPEHTQQRRAQQGRTQPGRSRGR